MPSIEIVCAGQEDPLYFEAPFAIVSERELTSHRSHTPFFQSDFDTMRGCIYHLGSPYLRDPKARGAFTAYELLDLAGEDRRRLVLCPEFASGVFELLAQLLEDSPQKQVVWTSDYQFGPRPRRLKRPLLLRRFQKLHDEKRLWLNALYTLRA